MSVGAAPPHRENVFGDSAVQAGEVGRSDYKDSDTAMEGSVAGKGDRSLGRGLIQLSIGVCAMKVKTHSKFLETGKVFLLAVLHCAGVKVTLCHTHRERRGSVEYGGLATRRRNWSISTCLHWDALIVRVQANRCGRY